MRDDARGISALPIANPPAATARSAGRAILAVATVLAVLAALAPAQAQTGAPTLETASADWTRLTLRFSQALDADSVAPSSAFTVLVGGTRRAPRESRCRAIRPFSR